MHLTINKDTPCRIPRTRLHQLAELIARSERIDESATLNVVLVDDEVQRRLNRDYRKRDKTTDVLSFASEVDQFSTLIGEIYISIPKTQIQAVEYEHPFSEELLRLFCHGMLHILGYDHAEEATEGEMFTLQDKYLMALRRSLSGKAQKASIS